ncbi:aldo/keto reductase family protein [Trichoderma velutinum]
MACQRLNTNALIPVIGFGCAADGSDQYENILYALKLGYRSIDTAAIYQTEEAVGKAIKDSGVPREEIFLTSKLWNHHHHPDDVGPACDASLKRLDLDYIDLYLIHWPVAFKRGDPSEPCHPKGQIELEDIDIVDTWKAMEKLVHSGKVKAIGVSNFTTTDIDRLIAKCSIIPADNQIELHPYLQQPKFAAYHKAKGIHITQFSPMGPKKKRSLANQSPLDDTVIVEIAKKYNKTPGQVILAWGICHGRSVIPKSSAPARIEENFGAASLKLSEEDVAKLNTLDRSIRINRPGEEWNVDAPVFQGLPDYQD